MSLGIRNCLRISAQYASSSVSSNPCAGKDEGAASCPNKEGATANAPAIPRALVTNLRRSINVHLRTAGHLRRSPLPEQGGRCDCLRSGFWKRDFSLEYRQGAAGFSALPVRKSGLRVKRTRLRVVFTEQFISIGHVSLPERPGRANHFKRLHVRCSLEQVLQNLQYLREVSGMAGWHAVLMIPEADRSHFAAVGSRKHDQVQEPFLHSQPGQDFTLHDPDEFHKRVRFQASSNLAGKHGTLPVERVGALCFHKFILRETRHCHSAFPRPTVSQIRRLFGSTSRVPTRSSDSAPPADPTLSTPGAPSTH